MDDRLSNLQRLALSDEKLRQKFIDTLSESEPLEAFCSVADECGIYLTAQELSVLGEESCAMMLRAQNGGGEYEPVGWDDDYDLFFLNLGVEK